MSVVRAPFDWVTLYSEDCRNGQSMLEPLLGLETLVGKLTMVRRCDTHGSCYVSHETQLSGPWSVTEWGSESHGMRETNNTGNNLVFLIHFAPVFVRPWEDLEVPELRASSKSGQVQSFPLLSLICFSHDVKNPLLCVCLLFPFDGHRSFFFFFFNLRVSFCRILCKTFDGTHGCFH